MVTTQDEIAQSVAAEVRAQLARQRRSGRSIAKEIGYSQQSMSLRLTGKIPLNVVELTAIARILGVPVKALLPDDLDRGVSVVRTLLPDGTEKQCNLAVAA